MVPKNPRGQRGVAVIEFALVAPIVLVILFAVFEFGTAMWRKQVLTTAVQVGARYGVVATNPRRTSTEISTAVTTYLAAAGWPTAPAVVDVTGAGGASGTSLTVRATYPTSFLILSRMPLGGGIRVDGGGNVILSAKVVTQLE